MPGKYLEFVKSGRYAVPVEIFFLPTSYTDEITGKESVTSKWVERKHWKEIKGLLKPAVDSCTNSNADGFSASPHISQGQEVSLGYVLCVDSSKEKSPFHAVLESKKNCWTDDEDDFDELDELCAGLRDHGGGTHRTHVPTKIYVKAGVIKRTSSAVNDSKKLKKELGFKGEDLRSYFQNTSPSGASAGLASALHDKEWKDSRNKRFGFGTLSGADTDKIRPFMPSLPRRLTMERPRGAVCSKNTGAYYEEQDYDEDSDDGYKEVDLYNDEGSDGSDDDNFSLPDIDAPQMDIQMKQLRKDMAKEEKKKQKVAFRKSQNHEKRKQKHSKHGSDLNERKRTVSLHKPVNDLFAHKIGIVVSPPTSPVKTSISISESVTKKSKKRLATKEYISDDAVPSLKKIKKTSKLLQERKINVVTKTSTKSRDQEQEVVESDINSSFTMTLKNHQSTKKSIKIKHKKHRKHTDDNSNISPEPNTLNEKLKDTVSKYKKRSSKRLKQTTATLDAGDSFLNDEIPRKDTSDQVKVIKTKKNKQVEFAPFESPSNLNAKKKKLKKKHKDVNKLIRLEPTEDELPQTEIDPDMPVLSPAVNSELEMPLDEYDELPPIITTMMELPPKKKKTKHHFNKSTSTQTAENVNKFRNDTPETNRRQEDGNNIENDSNSHLFVPVDMNVETREKQPHFMEEDENPEGGVFNMPSRRSEAPQDQQFLETFTTMPPPSRPAPRTPKKSDHQISIFRSGGLSMYPYGSHTSTVDPTRLSTIQLMCHPKILQAGFGLLKNLTTKKMTAEEVGHRLGFSDISTSKNRTRRKRELSPDITAFPQTSKHKDKGRQGDRRTNSLALTLHKQGETRGRDSEEEFSETDNQEGETLIRELLDRVHDNNGNTQQSYEPEGDDYDLSQNSMCYLNVIPGYPQKSRSFKIHCKNVEDLTFDKLVEHYIGIRPALRQIFEGEVANERSRLYLQSATERRRLQDMSVSIPFDHDQTSSIITLLLEYFIPDIEQRPKWSDYVNYVLLPEALINIYARVNEISYEIAQKEMRFQGCYDDTSQ